MALIYKQDGEDPTFQEAQLDKAIDAAINAVTTSNNVDIVTLHRVLLRKAASLMQSACTLRIQSESRKRNDGYSSN